MGIRTWSEKETQDLIEKYPTATKAELPALFPNKTLSSIFHKASRLGIHKAKETMFAIWSERNSLGRNPQWKDGKRRAPNGYVQVLRHGHPRADVNGYVMEHIVVFEEATGIQVPRKCVVHHLNGIKSDNRIENLCMMETGAHTKYHHSGKRNPKKGNGKRKNGQDYL